MARLKTLKDADSAAGGSAGKDADSAAAGSARQDADGAVAVATTGDAAVVDAGATPAPGGEAEAGLLMAEPEPAPQPDVMADAGGDGPAQGADADVGAPQGGEASPPEVPALPVAGPTDVPPAGDDLVEALDRAHATIDRMQGEYLAQSDRLAAVNARAASLEDEVTAKQGEIDALTKAVAERDAQIAALGSAPPPVPAEYAVHRPAAGDVLKGLDDFTPTEDAIAYLDAGELLVMVLADDNGVVQPFAPAIGGKAMFTPHGGSLLYAPLIMLEPELPLVSVRYAVLLDDDGNVLSVCRLGAVLIGGGGLSAMIPGNNLRFNFG